MSAPEDPVLAFLAAEARRPVAPEVLDLARAARTRFGPGVLAVLFYGSCLRDGVLKDRLVDLYLLSADAASVTSGALRRVLLERLPPDVYRLCLFRDGEPLRAKVSIVPLPVLERAVAPGTLEPYFWARLAQPVALVWAADASIEARILRILARAVRTFAAETAPLLGSRDDPCALFARGFSESYRTELRAEPPERARALVAAAPRRYRELGALLLAELPPPDATARMRALRLWRVRRRRGKLLSLLRLAKAASTFEDAAEYVAWKIERHAGVPVHLAPWQRRFPRLAGLLLLPRLLRRGAVR
ncbi:MAG: hypothetical protein N2038_07890 [Geminicoccaceae bacterium]|nr:hypothetical protein [Geminicoccaceae bacterium]MCS7267334.1 hypothetical protein [Geminicoccaceae bacterium]MCX7630157.1 hypothetical protein [Geminicoccaceae bacterium]MDW8125099.1 hypothetical protein [Geminicoccaceae bacterium]MDW8342096.1 hypothetical protein [Geminicoccaceae bacterium]